MTTEPSRGEPSGLHLFENDSDTVVARDEADAVAILVETYGGRAEDFERDLLQMRRVDDERKIEIWCNAAGIPDEVHGEGNRVLCLPAIEWAKRIGRGFLCTTEV